MKEKEEIFYLVIQGIDSFINDIEDYGSNATEQFWHAKGLWHALTDEEQEEFEQKYKNTFELIEYSGVIEYISEQKIRVMKLKIKEELKKAPIPPHEKGIACIGYEKTEMSGRDEKRMPIYHCPVHDFTFTLEEGKGAVSYQS